MALDAEPQPLFGLSSELREATALFGALNDEQLSKILHFSCRKRYASGEKIFVQGDLPTDIYVVCDGRIDLIVQKNGVFNIEACFQVGDSLGETALIGIQPQVGTAIVSGGVAELLVISRQDLLDLYESDKALYAVLMMNIAREVSRKLHCLMKAN